MSFNLELQRIISEHSLELQRAECRHWPTPHAHEILSGHRPRLGGGLTRPSSRSCQEIMEIILNTVQTVKSHHDFNGLSPLLDTLDQLDRGKNFRQITIDSENDCRGGVCAGLSQKLLTNIRLTHQIAGNLGAV